MTLCIRQATMTDRRERPQPLLIQGRYLRSGLMRSAGVCVELSVMLVHGTDRESGDHGFCETGTGKRLEGFMRGVAIAGVCDEGVTGMEIARQPFC